MGEITELLLVFEHALIMALKRIQRQSSTAIRAAKECNLVGDFN